jgi:hypothetical protein
LHVYLYDEKICERDLFHFVKDVIVEKNRESEIEAGYNTTILNRIESEDIKNYHWIAIQEWVDKYVGEYKAEEGETPIREEGVVGNMYFNRTLEDWLKFDPNDRTKRDASISSGFAILALNRHKYKPQIEAPKLSLKFKTY